MCPALVEADAREFVAVCWSLYVCEWLSVTAVAASFVKHVHAAFRARVVQTVK